MRVQAVNNQKSQQKSFKGLNLGVGFMYNLKKSGLERPFYTVMPELKKMAEENGVDLTPRLERLGKTWDLRFLATPANKLKLLKPLAIKYYKKYNIIGDIGLPLPLLTKEHGCVQIADESINVLKSKLSFLQEI